MWEMWDAENIFGSPTEPIFNCKDFGLQDDMLEESLYILADQNERQIEQYSSKEGLFKEGNVAEFVFLLCCQLKLMPNTNYTALELFDRFMASHICGLYDIVRASSSKDKEADWKEVEERIKEQLPLRIISCVQIASKLVSHHKALSPSQVRRFLLSIGYNYSISSVVKSELRVLKSLDFKVMVVTPLVYMETLLEILGSNNNTLNVKILHNVGTKLLDVFYMKRRSLYHQLCDAVCPQTEDVNQTICILGNDYLLLATAIIVAAAFTVDKGSIERVFDSCSNEFFNVQKAAVESLKALDRNKTSKVIDLVHEITQISKENIEDFARVITNEALGGVS